MHASVGTMVGCSVVTGVPVHRLERIEESKSKSCRWLIEISHSIQRCGRSKLTMMKVPLGPQRIQAQERTSSRAARPTCLPARLPARRQYTTVIPLPGSDDSAQPYCKVVYVLKALGSRIYQYLRPRTLQSVRTEG